jgi:hypothetical protein
MSKRLQVILDDEELLEIQRIAELKQMTVAEWVRQTLRAARRGESTGDPSHKLAAIRAAARNSFPTADVDEMLEQIESGYTGRK